MNGCSYKLCRDQSVGSVFAVTAHPDSPIGVPVGDNRLIGDPLGRRRGEDNVFVVCT